MKNLSKQLKLFFEFDKQEIKCYHILTCRDVRVVECACLENR